MQEQQQKVAKIDCCKWIYSTFCRTNYWNYRCFNSVTWLPLQVLVRAYPSCVHKFWGHRAGCRPCNLRLLLEYVEMVQNLFRIKMTSQCTMPHLVLYKKTCPWYTSTHPRSIQDAKCSFWLWRHFTRWTYFWIARGKHQSARRNLLVVEFVVLKYVVGAISSEGLISS